MATDSLATQSVAKAALLFYLTLWMLWHIWRTSRISTYPLNGMRRIRTVFTIFLLLGVSLQIVPYAIEAHFNYFVSHDPNSVSLSLPKQFADYCESAGMSFLALSLFTLQLFWHELAQRAMRKQFMKEWEYKIYIVACFTFFPLFPTLRAFLREDLLLRDHVPQIVFGWVALIVSLLSVRVYIRLRNAIHVGTLSRRNRIKKKLDYFLDMNTLFTISILIFSISLLLLHLDSIQEAPVILSNNFTADILCVHLTLSSVAWYTASLLIIYPYIIVISAPKELISPPETPIESQEDYFSPITMGDVPKLAQLTLPQTPPYSLSGKRRVATPLAQSSTKLAGATTEEPSELTLEIKPNLQPPPRPHRQNTIKRSQQSPQPLIGQESLFADDASFVSSEAGMTERDFARPSLMIDMAGRRTPSYITGSYAPDT